MIAVETNPADFTDWPALHALLTAAFAVMEGRIDPPSSLATMTPDSLRRMASTHDLFLVRHRAAPVACLYGTQNAADYYVSKLAISPDHRGQGLARAMLDAASDMAQRKTLARITLQTRIELVENHATFTRLGFVRTCATAHPGFDRATSLSFARDLSL